MAAFCRHAVPYDVRVIVVANVVISYSHTVVNEVFSSVLIQRFRVQLNEF